jgi:hypothetical protein
MRPLRHSINVTLDGCCDHREMFADEDLHRHAAENLDQADALIFGRVTYEMMAAARRSPGAGQSAAWCSLDNGVDGTRIGAVGVFDGSHRRRSVAINANSSKARRSSTISAAITSGAGRFAASSRLSSRSQKMSRLALSRFTGSSYVKEWKRSDSVAVWRLQPKGLDAGDLELRNPKGW